MRAAAFYDKLSELNDALYQGAKDFKGWKLLDTYSDNTGVFIALYDIGNWETLFAIKGTEAMNMLDLKDIGADIDLLVRKSTKQANSAVNYYQTIKDKYSNIIFTGYSLGGSVAQLLCKQFGNETICFEPYGTGKFNGNCINFGNVWDIFFMQNPEGMPGEVYIIPMPMPKSGKRDITTHLPYQHGKPSTAKKNTAKLENNAHYFARIGAEKGKQVAKDTYNSAKSYLRDGIIPSVQQKIASLKKVTQ